MKLDKAIYNLTNLQHRAWTIDEPDTLEALQMGKEALKRCKYLYEHTSRWANVRLPGETKE